MKRKSETSVKAFQKEIDDSSDEETGSPKTNCKHKKLAHAHVEIQEHPLAFVDMPVGGVATITLHAVNEDPGGGDFAWASADTQVTDVQGMADQRDATFMSVGVGTTSVDVQYTTDEAVGFATCTFEVRAAPTIDLAAPRAVLIPATYNSGGVVVYTQPARLTLRLGTTAGVNFDGTGTLSCTPVGAVRIFDAPNGGNEVLLPAAVNTAALVNQTPLYVQGALPSAALDGSSINLSLIAGALPVSAATAQQALTSIALTVDLCKSRPAVGNPVPLTAQEKHATGRHTQFADPAHTHERTQVIVRAPVPNVGADLILAAENNDVRIFAEEVPANGQVAINLPYRIPLVQTGGAGKIVWAEGVTVSNAPRATGFTLGLAIAGSDLAGGDLAKVTVVKLEVLDAAGAAATFVRYGLWDQAWGGGYVLHNLQADNAHFVGRDSRRFNFRVTDATAAGSFDFEWVGLAADLSDFDAPASKVLTMTNTGGIVAESKAVMLVTNDFDRNQQTHSGFNGGPTAGARARGQADHRLRKASLDGFVGGVHTPAPDIKLTIRRPLFDRAPDFRTSVTLNVVRYNDVSFVSATNQYIADQFTRANERWNQVGLEIRRNATTERNIPADWTIPNVVNAGFPLGPNIGDDVAMLDPMTNHLDSDSEPSCAVMLRDVISITADNTITVVFVPLDNANAQTEIDDHTVIFRRMGFGVVDLQQRLVIMMNTACNINHDTLAHELFHALYNRYDRVTPREFFPWNTNPPASPPNIAQYRRMQILFGNPDNDPQNDVTLNWHLRQRTQRYGQPNDGAGIQAANNSTGNTVVGAY